MLLFLNSVPLYLFQWFYVCYFHFSFRPTIRLYKLGFSFSPTSFSLLPVMVYYFAIMMLLVAGRAAPCTGPVHKTITFTSFGKNLRKDTLYRTRNLYLVYRSCTRCCTTSNQQHHNCEVVYHYW